METTAYDPVQGTGYEQEAARAAWSVSMYRSRREGPEWTVQGLPASSGGTGFYWRYFSFQPFTGRVSVDPDGFHWQPSDYHTGEVIHSGVTTLLYAAYQSVVQNKPVDPPPVRP